MPMIWKLFRAGSRKWLKTGWMFAAALTAVYMGLLQPMEDMREIASQKQTGLGAVAGSSSPYALLNSLKAERDSARSSSAIVLPLQTAGLSIKIPVIASPIVQGRKMIRTASMELIVKTPAESAEKIRALAERMGGYLETSQLNGSDSYSASLTVRVPATCFEEARTEIRKLGLRVENERVEAQDATKQYVDQEAGLRNLRAEETQYLAILKAGGDGQ